MFMLHVHTVREHVYACNCHMLYYVRLCMHMYSSVLPSILKGDWPNMPSVLIFFDMEIRQGQKI